MKPIVSVMTLTYNHAPFISRCVEGALMQKTTFPYELVIGEDCSTDGTREIVLEYARKYPEMIRVITSESNVGVKESWRRSLSGCQGEYIALCEGDDYWIDPLKLQKQYEAILKYDAILITHSTFVVFFHDGENTNELKIRRARNESGYLDFKDILYRKEQFHTSSFFLHSDTLRNLPDWYYQASVGGDFSLKIITAYLGKVYYIDETMSVYNKGLLGSYTDRKLVSIVQKDGGRAILEKDFLKLYINFNHYTKYQFTDMIRECIQDRLLYYYDTFGNLDFLELSEVKNKALKIISILTRPFFPRFRKKILGEIVNHVKFSEKIL
jgi:glycosyltransferase involved in cell wall biosynthesis